MRNGLWKTDVMPRLHGTGIFTLHGTGELSAMRVANAFVVGIPSEQKEVPLFLMVLQCLHGFTTVLDRI